MGWPVKSLPCCGGPCQPWGDGSATLAGGQSQICWMTSSFISWNSQVWLGVRLATLFCSAGAFGCTCSQVTHAKCASDIIVDVYIYICTTGDIYVNNIDNLYLTNATSMCVYPFSVHERLTPANWYRCPPHGLEGLWIMLAFTSSLEALLSIHACPGHRNLFPHWSGWWLDYSAGKGGSLLRLYKSIGAQQVGFGNWYNAVFSHWEVDGPKLKTRDTTVVLVSTSQSSPSQVSCGT